MFLGDRQGLTDGFQVVLVDLLIHLSLAEAFMMFGQFVIGDHVVLSSVVHDRRWSGVVWW